MNARMETAGEKPIFKRLVNRRRCVIAFNGFFEWKKDSKGEKQPYYIYRKDGKPVLLAGNVVMMTLSESDSHLIVC